mgnify:CR=1 FL=1
MQPQPYWPITPLTLSQEIKFDLSFNRAIIRAGSIGKLAPKLSSHSGEYISHQAMRNWLADRKIPIQWALVMEDYTEGESQFFDLVPWMLPRAVQYSENLWALQPNDQKQS